MTGEARFRRSWTGKLVLQTEHRRGLDPAVGGVRYYWRDAAERDLWRLRATRNQKKLEPLL